MATKFDLTNRVFGRLTVIKENGRDKNGKFRWDCICICGNKVNKVGASLLNGDTSSCGCLQLEVGFNNKRHGMSRTPEFRSWQNMKGRCYNIKNNRYKNYGGRGIIVCDRWIDSFDNFYEDMGNKPSKKHSLDRKDVQGNYCKGN